MAALVRYFAGIPRTARFSVATVPWEVPDDLDVDRYAAELRALHDSGTDLRFTQRRFFLSLTRPRG